MSIYIYIHTFIYVYVCIYTYTCIYIYIYIHWMDDEIPEYRDPHYTKRPHRCSGGFGLIPGVTDHGNGKSSMGNL